MTDAFHIRPARLEDAAAIARLQVDSYRDTYAGIFPRDYLDLFSYDDQASDWLALLSSATSDVILVAEALEANPARGFHQRLGAIQLEGRKLTVNAYEVAYGLPDIRMIPRRVSGGAT
jgi:hypothetical protein